MKKSIHVYILKPDLVDPRFHGFIFGAKAKSILELDDPIDDFHPINDGLINWKPRNLSQNWKPQPVDGPVNPFNDYPCLELATPVFSKRAVDALGDILTRNGELLPLRTSKGEYFAFNLKTIRNALDLRKSVLRRTSPERTAVSIEYFSFKDASLRDTTIFRVPENSNVKLVTDIFKERVESSCLNGFNFIPVWPLPEGTDWRMEEAKRRKKNKAVKLVGESLILRLRLKKPKPSPNEKRLASDIEQSLRSTLKVSSLKERYWGSVEVAEFEDGEYRIFCSCPDVDQIAGHLSDWLESVPWENDFDIVKRYGNLFDKKAKEKRIQIRSANP
ncbi:MAG: hypothetical protein ACK6AO_06255 [Planctomycetota bacterium]|jgi:hypothetical protein